MVKNGSFFTKIGGRPFTYLYWWLLKFSPDILSASLHITRVTTTIIISNKPVCLGISSCTSHFSAYVETQYITNVTRHGCIQQYFHVSIGWTVNIEMFQWGHCLFETWINILVCHRHKCNGSHGHATILSYIHSCDIT